ncbi:hypothetical protein M408DRAFT_328392 [Serendipita vermifera MAFF 305830]|uniref:PNPLA domain-containing protein n=1 Tax=Serendipita vermifera MAFF 305830 TaxID=933852 RepID=A0A0C2WUR3_SERVB|nr:hypothetical protein M408DRAFT_328392 [Serendipita vermifera MAFF 305830]
MSKKGNLKLVSFDGGGIRGLSQLEIMGNIMHRLNWEEQKKGSGKEKLACEYFDLIGGSGTGGLIAILLGKLRMTVDKVSDEFCTIIEKVYAQNDLEPAERSDLLRRCMEDILERNEFPPDMKLLGETPVGDCACFVVASQSANADATDCLRTYPIRGHRPTPITVIEAVLATCATQPDFSPISLGDHHKKREYIGASLGANNPVLQVIQEAHSLFGGDSGVASILSMGTGHPGVISYRSGDTETGLHKTMRDIMNDCEQRAQQIEQQIGRTGVYSRFSVEQGMQNDHQGQFEDSGWIVAQTESYLNRHTTCERLDSFVLNVNSTTAATAPVTLDQLRRSLH